MKVSASFKTNANESYEAILRSLHRGSWSMSSMSSQTRVTPRYDCGKLLHGGMAYAGAAADRTSGNVVAVQMVITKFSTIILSFDHVNSRRGFFQTNAIPEKNKTRDKQI